MIWAADLLKVIRDDVHLLIIGDGPQRQALERYHAACATSTTQVHFLGSADDVPRLMPHFDVLWLASGYEGLSNVILEAMAAACRSWPPTSRAIANWSSTARPAIWSPSAIGPAWLDLPTKSWRIRELARRLGAGRQAADGGGIHRRGNGRAARGVVP